MQNDDLQFLIATLIEHFHLTPNQIGNLTDAQIFGLYCYPRDNKGSLKPPLKEIKPVPKKEYNTFEDEMMVLDMLKKNLGPMLKGYENEVARIKHKYGRE